jgi:tetratricopeptide (TPR) repeat protein
MMIRSSAALALVLGCGVALAGCGRMNDVRAMKAFKDGNKFYSANDYRQAAQKYEEAIQLDPEDDISSCGPSGPGCIHFFLANSYDNMYRPTRRGEAVNDGYLDKAIAHYKIASEKITGDPKMRTLSLQYLVATYGADKLNDPTSAEPVVKAMIDIEPNEPTNYFVLAKIYSDSGEYELAEQTFLKAREVRPNDPAVHMQLAGFYNSQGDFDKTIASVIDRTKVEPNNPEGFQTLATYYWDKAYRDFRLSDKEKLQYVRDGIEAVDKALSLKADYMEAVAYKNLLLRLQANLSKDPGEQQRLLREADQLRELATKLQKQKAAGAQ